ncbi:unnamed protein product [Periconia digitata]|uniref:HpcH/HpaI aldolase/citrate lyase domain-containing protein n=1 Tax=Periconia digitata TaxID=1303443 RepID=A0A9W4U410_9PLEO|nr:unnamed protein product [Periconia digitata]
MARLSLFSNVIRARPGSFGLSSVASSNTSIHFITTRKMNSLQQASRIYKAFQAQEPSFGGWQMLPGANISRAIARSGVDWICVDCEHGNIDDSQMHEAVVAIAATGVSPIVRIAANEAWMVKPLDSGAHGIVVPLIYTVDDAKRLVSSAKFPPQGQRGFGSPFTPQAFTNDTLSHYLENANASLITILQIETKSALESAQEIAAVPGVDCLLIGPFDLGNNIGRPILHKDGMHQELKDAIEKIKEAAHAEGKKVGIYCTSGEQAKEYAKKGFDVISVSADASALPAYFSQTLAAAKGQ